MSAVLKSIEARFEPLALHNLEAVLSVEQRAYAHPWSRNNFVDTLASGYEAQLLLGGDTLLGYFVAMKGVDEVHLLNITVDPDYQRQGWARVMLDALSIWAKGQRADWLWLEVRVGNLRAMKVYESQGFGRVGLRKNYYPAVQGQREDAVVMSRPL
ncbi:MAG: ribosomal protein S18-alanine N-acetyltransferase [Rhodoferax sp.]|uniref:ribosomal protein S18-alanine N-acetyltransferase n=1 Tax=Rhodoferax sp. TaxID=50421 RepID=UPI00183AE5E4|nr:ribosomal protein S18-alanine N-acetyltransferase [Rhodoferax sp.]NMM13943.1 ribosomal protein S18-alanine N-acetyltransferase [Rhodoferax sp.]NMM19541.1 ribosomal protein S18-alanine N-acetyltransferase [Rhodoferax sp.]